MICDFTCVYYLQLKRNHYSVHYQWFNFIIRSYVFGPDVIIEWGPGLPRDVKAVVSRGEGARRREEFLLIEEDYLRGLYTKLTSSEALAILVMIAGVYGVMEAFNFIPLEHVLWVLQGRLLSQIKKSIERARKFTDIYVFMCHELKSLFQKYV